MTPFQQMDPSGLRLGERLTLTCSVTKGDLPLSFSWTVDGRPVNTNTGVGPVKTVQIDPYTNLLSVDSLQPAHSGNYSCSVTNTATTVVSHQQQSQLVVIQGTKHPTLTPISIDFLFLHFRRPSLIDCRSIPAPHVMIACRQVHKRTL